MKKTLTPPKEPSSVRDQINDSLTTQGFILNHSHISALHRKSFCIARKQRPDDIYLCNMTYLKLSFNQLLMKCES